MAIPTTYQDKRLAAGGAGFALLFGLMLGGLMHPDLAGDGRPAGPQQILGKAAQRSTGPFDPGPEMASWTGKVPEYVLGTDWTRATAPPAPAAVSPPAAEPVRYAQADDDVYEPPRGAARAVLIVPPREEPVEDARYSRRADPRYDPRFDPRYREDDEPPPAPRNRYPSLGDHLPRHAPVGQAIDDAYEDDPGR